MGEIKSTLDIIMEKTKGLTMNDEERESLRRTELADRVKGWVQRYTDNLINGETLKSELKKEGEENDSMLEELIKAELVERINLDDDNLKIFELMKNLLKINEAPYVKIIKDFQEEAALERSERLVAIKRVIMQRGISGSAVIPNLTPDESWDAYHRELEASYKKRLRSVTDN